MMPDEVTIESVALPGRTGAFRVTLRDGSIRTIRPAEQTGDAAWLALPGFANLHAHADRAYTVQSFRQFVEVNDALGGPQGLQVKGMNFFGWDLNSSIGEVSFYTNYVVMGLALAAFAFVIVRRLERSWVGLNLDAVRLDETACAVFGIDVARWKILAFTFGNFFAGVAGAAYAMMTGFVAPNSFTFGDSLILVSIVLLGGLGNAWGVALAAAIVLVLPEKLQALQEYRFLLYALLVIAILMVRPQGLIPRRAREYFR